MEIDSKILVAGYRGLVGSSIIRKLLKDGYSNLLMLDRDEIDLCNQQAVNNYFECEKPEYLFLAAAKVGGIYANSTYPADFIRDNLLIQTLVIDAAWRNGVKRCLFLSSSAIYPKLAERPFKEEYLMTGLLESANEPYAVAKIAGIKMCQSYRKQFGFDVICMVPTNLYGPGDNFSSINSHVVPALISKFHSAKITNNRKVIIWGTGSPKREFLYVEDLADAAVFLMKCFSNDIDDIAPERIINVGVGKDIEIYNLAHLLREIIYPNAEIMFDKSKPDGNHGMLLDISRLDRIGWKAKVKLREGLVRTYEWYVTHLSK